MSAILRDEVPPQPTDERDLLGTTQKLVKSSESLRDILLALISTLDSYPPTRIVDAQGQVLMALADKIGFVNAPASVSIIGALQPGSDVSTHSDPKYTITYGTYGLFIPTISGTALSAVTASNIITLGPGDTYVYMQCDFTYDASGVITIGDAEIKTGSGTPPVSTISLGSGQVNQVLFAIAITAPVGAGPYSVTASPAVSGSQNFSVCLSGPSISGPYLN